MSEEEKLFDFEAFRAEVGASEPSVRTALKVLKIEPIRPVLRDRRQTRYRPEWVAEVRKWIENNLASS